MQYLQKNYGTLLDVNCVEAKHNGPMTGRVAIIAHNVWRMLLSNDDKEIYCSG